MANGHTHGSRGYLELLKADGTTWYNLTPHIPGYNAPRTQETVQDTGMQPEDDTHTYLQGLLNGTYDFTPNLTDDGELLLIVKAIRQKDDRSGTTIREFPAGKVDGKYAESATILFTNPGSKTVEINGAFKASFGAQITGPITSGVWDSSANGGDGGIVDPS